LYFAFIPFLFFFVRRYIPWAFRRFILLWWRSTAIFFLIKQHWIWRLRTTIRTLGMYFFLSRYVHSSFPSLSSIWISREVRS
jgi:hypothetical protein